MNTNETNFQNILIQCSLNHMIIIHMILDCSISVTHEDKHWAVICKTLYARTTYLNIWMYNWKESDLFIQWLFKLY